MQWRDRADGPGTLLGDIHQLQSRNLPVGWVILDNPWETGATNGCFGSLHFDPKIYPKPAKLIRQVHARGVRFMLWISPELRKKGCPPHAIPDGWMTGDDDYLVRDLTNPRERADFVRRVSALAALGVDGFKGDRGDEVDLEKNTLVGGPGVLLQNSYPLLYAKAVADAMKGHASTGRVSSGQPRQARQPFSRGLSARTDSRRGTASTTRSERPKQQASLERRCGGRTSGATRAVAT
jgi:alpha-D-xyloside xylohydrolase